MGQAPPERREWKLPEPEPPPREHRRDTSPINWSGVIDQRIAAEHAFMIEVIGQAMGELREQIETNVRKEFEEQLRSLSVELCDRENSLRRIAHQQHRAARAIDGHGNTIHLPVLPLRGSRAN